MQADHVFIIAEAGVNHNGNVELAFDLCRAAKEAGANTVKFQTWKTENIITKSVEQAEYQKMNTGKDEAQYDMLKCLELSYKDFERIKEYCDSIDIIFSSTADEEESLDFLIQLGIPFIKIGSAEITNIPYLRYIGSKKMPVLLSTGMSYLSDVDIAYRTLRDAGTSDISILHCTTNYPCPYEDVNLRALKTLEETFHCPIGYSDHTMGIDIPLAAVAMGASVIEKHFTLDKNMEGPDHAASATPEQFNAMVNAIRNLEIALGNGVKQPSESEKTISQVVLKRIVAKRDIMANEYFSEDSICVKRHNTGLPASLWDLVINKRARKNYKKDEAICFDD
jgi:N-acetylneuraminate synthase/N,N'-diacetyllegionaminate synthase